MRSWVAETLLHPKHLPAVQRSDCLPSNPYHSVNVAASILDDPRHPGRGVRE